jgi:hypothetical protein
MSPRYSNLAAGVVLAIVPTTATTIERAWCTRNISSTAWRDATAACGLGAIDNGEIESASKFLDRVISRSVCVCDAGGREDPTLFWCGEVAAAG